MIEKITIVRGLPAKQSFKRFVSLVRQGEGAWRAAAFYLLDIDKRGEYKALGYSSAVHMADKGAGLSRRTARDLLRVAQALEALHKTDEAFAAGEVSWSKVREITLVATPEKEEEWLTYAKEHSTQQVEVRVKRARKGDGPNSEGIGTPRTRFRLEFEVPALTRDVFMSALERLLSDGHGGKKLEDENAVSRALRRMGEIILGRESPARGEGPRPVYAIVIHKDQSGATWVEDAGGRVPLSPEEVAEVTAGASVVEVRDLVRCCEGDEITFGERGTTAPEDRDPPVSEELRAAVFARDGYKCVVCGSTRNLHAHHLEARANGGATRIEFIVTLCGACHSSGHEKLLKLKTDAEGRVVAYDRDGEPLLKRDGAAEVLGDGEPGSPMTLIEEVEAAPAAAEGGPCGPPTRMLSDTAEPTCEGERGPYGPRAPVEIPAELPAEVAAADGREFASHLEWNRERRVFMYDEGLHIVTSEPSSGPSGASEAPGNPLRPRRFAEIVGQRRAVENLEVAVRAALSRGEPLDHVLLSGPAGLGKTTLAQAIATELGAPFYTAMGAMIEQPNHLIALLTRIKAGGVLFIDEIHRLGKSCEECLYTALEDRVVDIPVLQDQYLRAVRLNLSPFTLIGATTLPGSLSEPFRSRFGIQEQLEFYAEEELTAVAERAAAHVGVAIDRAAAAAVGCRARGTPRETLRLLSRARDQAHAAGDAAITFGHVEEAARRLGIDGNGLGPLDRRILKLLLVANRPVGIDTIADALRLDAVTIRSVYEPYLLERGFLLRGPRGRQVTAKARREYAA